MKTHKLTPILFIFLLLTGQSSFGAQQSQQILSVGLAQVMEIEKIMTETQEYNRDQPMPSVRIREEAPQDLNNTYLMLSPMKVQIHTNSATPILVTAQFRELKHTGGLYDFNPANLTVSPTSYTINNPFDHVITNEFTPMVDVKPDTVIGTYRGSMMFTLGAI